jgi:hypothetical protein
MFLKLLIGTMNNYQTLTLREDKITIVQTVFEISDSHKTNFIVSVKKVGFNMNNAKA